MNTENTFYPEMAAMLVIFILILTAFFIIYKKLKTRVNKTKNRLDDFVLKHFRIPLLLVLLWSMLKLFSHVFLNDLVFYRYLVHINNILVILSIAWILMKLVKLGAYILQRRLDVNVPDNLKARKSLTQMKVFQGIADTIIIIFTVSVILLTFDEAKTIGKSILASAGVAGIIIGFAAQKSIGMFLAGIQIAISQPIRLDDVVIVENEWGRIEEITLTYVVVKIWDERRLILPVNYFLENPFQNWTRTSADILGTVFIYAGYNLPVEEIRNFIPGILKNNPNWDERVWNVQVTNTNEWYQEVRILVSSENASKNWDLRTEVREKIIQFIQTYYPQCFVKVRFDKTSVKGV